MPENEAQVRGLGRGDLFRQVGQFVEARRVRLGLIRDERSTQFEEDKFGHKPVVPQILLRRLWKSALMNLNGESSQRFPKSNPML